MFDIIIRNGTIIDGTGKAKFQADIGITGERIEAIDNLHNAESNRVIDATNLSRNLYFTTQLMELNIPIHYLDRSHGWSTTKYKELLAKSLNN